LFAASGVTRAQTYENYRTFCETRSLQIVTNIAICLIHQTNYLLDQQIRSLERAFIMEGGLRERMTRARRLQRQLPGSRPDP
jgi:four helix bundle suffix protein